MPAARTRTSTSPAPAMGSGASSTRRTAGAPNSRTTMAFIAGPPADPRSFAHLLREVVLLAELLHEHELRLVPVDRVLLFVEHLLGEQSRAVVALLAEELDHAVQALDGDHLEREVELVLLDRVLADLDGREALHVRHALEVEDALDQPVGVAHLL